MGQNIPLLKKILNTVKSTVFEKGRLIYDINVLSFKHSIESIRNKEKHKKVKIGFILQCPQNWITLEPVFQAAMQDEQIDPVVLLVPEMEYKMYLFLKGVHFQETYQFGEKEICGEYIKTYDPESDKWIDPQSLEMDYVFIPRPYETYLPKLYKASHLRRFVKVVYAPYAFPLLNDSPMIYNAHFSRNVYLFCCESQFSANYLNKKFKRTVQKGYQKVHNTGYPRYDLLKNDYYHESPLWPRQKSEKIQRIIWTPRWTVDPKLGGSHFFDYKDQIISYAEDHDDVDLVFRPHPMALDNYVSQGLLTQTELESYLNRYKNCPNATVDREKRYFDTFYSSDVLITDISSVINDYLFSGNPIIYCPSPRDDEIVLDGLLDAMYVVHDFNEISRILCNIKAGKDEKKILREKLVKELKRDGQISQIILNLIKKDYNI